MKSLILACFVCMMAAACSNSNEKIEPTNVAADTTSFYPIASYIQSQLKYFDSMHADYSVVTTEGIKKDSATAQLTQVMPVIQSFINADISDSIQKKNYKNLLYN